ncbi:hypothetical protein ACOMHN_027710 [Nucella lapillus]
MINKTRHTAPADSTLPRLIRAGCVIGGGLGASLPTQHFPRPGAPQLVRPSRGLHTTAPGLHISPLPYVLLTAHHIPGPSQLTVRPVDCTPHPWAFTAHRTSYGLHTTSLGLHSLPYVLWTAHHIPGPSQLTDIQRKQHDDRTLNSVRAVTDQPAKPGSSSRYVTDSGILYRIFSKGTQQYRQLVVPSVFARLC